MADCPPPNVWEGDDSITVHYFVRHPWSWVMASIRTKNMIEVENLAALPTSVAALKAAASGEAVPEATPRTRRRRPGPKNRHPSTLKIEICHARDENILFAAHGTSAALDGLEDKDELVRTMQRCRCEDKHLSPPSILINWDVTHDECLNVVGDSLPTLKENKSKDKFVVLKEPMGSQGKGVFFVRTAEEIHQIINTHRQRAQKEPNFLDNLIEAKGRIPSWVLQAEVTPCLLIRGRRKFHIRTYVVILEELDNEDLLEAFVYSRHEVRIAGVPVPEDEEGRDRKAHITNGALSTETERVLLDDVEELMSRNMKARVELFVATTFGSDLMKDISGRVRVSADDNSSGIQKFALAGLDLMVTETNRIYLLEVNANPAAPKAETISEKFREHLEGFFRDLTSLVTLQPSPNFLSAIDIMARNGIQR